MEQVLQFPGSHDDFIDWLKEKGIILQAAMSDWLENEVGNHFLRGQAATAIATVYIALFLSDPTDANTGTEVTGGSYARIPVVFDVPSPAGVFANQLATFVEATASWGLVTHMGLMRTLTATADDLMYHGALTTSKTINSGDTARFVAGDLVVTHQ